jgi:hypothetical protein
MVRYASGMSPRGTLASVSARHPLVGRAAQLARVDLPPRPRQPALEWVALATLIAIAASLLADAALVAAGTTVFPSTVGYDHFRFDDYARLTVIGVVIGCAGWPVVTRITSAPRWLFCRLAVLITLVLFLPDAWLLVHHQPVDAVAILMVMHVAVALITYTVVVRMAPANGHRRDAAPYVRTEEEG